MWHAYCHTSSTPKEVLFPLPPPEVLQKFNWSSWTRCIHSFSRQTWCKRSHKDSFWGNLCCSFPPFTREETSLSCSHFPLGCFDGPLVQFFFSLFPVSHSLPCPKFLAQIKPWFMYRIIIILLLYTIVVVTREQEIKKYARTWFKHARHIHGAAMNGVFNWHKESCHWKINLSI